MPAVRLLHRSNLALIVAVTAALALTACSNSSAGDGSGAGGAGRPAASASGPVAANLAKYGKSGGAVKVDFPPVKGAAAKLKGKSIYYIPILTNAPLFQSQANLLRSAASRVGLSMTICNGNANPADITSCFNQAISAGAAGIVSDSVPPELVPQAYAHVVSAKVPTVALNINEDVPSRYASMVSAFDRQEVLQGRISADQIIADSGGRAHVLLVGLNDSATTTNTIRYGIKPEFRDNCPKCTVSEILLNSSQVGNVHSLVATGLVQHPDVDYVFAQYDVLVPGAIQGIGEEQKASSVKLVSINGTLSALQAIKVGKVFADTGVDINYEAWASLDILIRAITKADPMAAGHGRLIPIRTYTKATMGDLTLTQSAYQSGTWFGTPSYEAKFVELWGVQ